MSTPQNPHDPNRPYVPEGYELSKKKKPFYKRLGCIVPLAILAALILVIATSMGGGDDDTGNTDGTNTTAPTEPGAGAPAEDSQDDVPSEYNSALRSAESYLRTGNFSQAGLYNQLTSQFDQFSAEAAQYAIDNVDADWNAEALDAAESYQRTSNMSPAAIYDQLTSEFEGYTPEQAQYAVDNLS